jgi:hypothetical protein
MADTQPDSSNPPPPPEPPPPAPEVQVWSPRFTTEEVRSSAGTRTEHRDKRIR